MGRAFNNKPKQHLTAEQVKEYSIFILWASAVSISPTIDLFLIKGVVVLVVFITFKKDEKKFRQIAMDEKEQEKSELPPLLGTKEVKESGELEKED